jgi:hypothetical protein
VDLIECLDHPHTDYVRSSFFLPYHRSRQLRLRENASGVDRLRLLMILAVPDPQDICTQGDYLTDGVIHRDEMKTLPNYVTAWCFHDV